MLSCLECPFLRDATASDYLSAGFWPGCPSVGSYLFSDDLFIHWQHTQHKSPGSSERKFIETLEDISRQWGRVCVH